MRTITIARYTNATDAIGTVALPRAESLVRIHVAHWLNISGAALGDYSSQLYVIAGSGLVLFGDIGFATNDVATLDVLAFNILFIQRKDALQNLELFSNKSYEVGRKFPARQPIGVSMSTSTGVTGIAVVTLYLQ